MSTATSKESISSKTQRLNDLVSWFEGEDFSLEQAIENYEKAQKLASEIEADLLSLKNDIEVVKQKFDA